MINRTSCIWFYLFVIVISLIMFGCSNDNCQSCSSSNNQGAPLIVTVADNSGARMPNTTVVLGDSNGAMITYGQTDADGQITFDNAPSDATITATTSCLRSGSTNTTYSIDVELDVNGSVVLSLDNCSNTGISPGIPSISSSLSSTPVGTVTVNITNMPSEVSQQQLLIGQYRHIMGSVVTSLTFTVYETDLTGYYKISLKVTGLDADYNTIAYGQLLNEPFTSGMTVDLPMEPISYVQYEIINIPDTAVNLQYFLSAYMYASSGLGFSPYPSSPLASLPSSTTVAVPYIPVSGNGFRYQIVADLDQDHDGIADSNQSLSLSSSASLPSNQTFDLSQMLSAPSVTVTNADTATPTFSWSGIDPASNSIFVSARLLSTTADWYIFYGNLKRSRSRIQYPELPDSLSAFKPNKIDYFTISTSSYEGNLSKSSSSSYRAPNP